MKEICNEYKPYTVGFHCGLGDNKADNEVSQYWKDKYENYAGYYWHQFYCEHQNHFFKDRHWLTREFPDLCTLNHATILEIGCGVGNTLFPLLSSLHPSNQFIGIDFAQAGLVEIEKDARYDPHRLQVHFGDLTKDSIHEIVPKGSVHCILLIFVLSAICPNHIFSCVERCYHLLLPGGKVYFRDYLQGDMSQMRFDQKHQRVLSQGTFYVRGDGTRVLYFEQDKLVAMCEEIGFHVIAQPIEITKHNRKEGKEMHRKFIQLTLTKGN